VPSPPSPRLRRPSVTRAHPSRRHFSGRGGARAHSSRRHFSGRGGARRSPAAPGLRRSPAGCQWPQPPAGPRCRSARHMERDMGTWRREPSRPSPPHIRVRARRRVGMVRSAEERVESERRGERSHGEAPPRPSWGESRAVPAQPERRGPGIGPAHYVRVHREHPRKASFPPTSRAGSRARVNRPCRAEKLQRPCGRPGPGAGQPACRQRRPSD
jgi:hypothetical protein